MRAGREGEGHPSGAGALAEACAEAGFRPRIDFPVREWTAKQGFVAAGLGLALVPTLSASAARADIVLAPLTRTRLIRRVYAATPRLVRPPAPVTAFLPHLEAVARELAR